jgi:hypothetical protein
MATIRDLLGGLGVTLSLCSALTVLTLFLPAGRHGGGSAATRPSGLVLIAAGIYVAATLVFAVLMCLHNPWQLAGTVVIVAISSLWFVLFRTGSDQSQIDQDTE